MNTEVQPDIQTEAILIVALERLKDPKTGNADAARAVAEALSCIRKPDLQVGQNHVIVEDDDGEI